MKKYIKDIHFSVHSILVNEELKRQFYKWAKGEETADKIPRTLDPVYSPIRKTDIPDSISWNDIIDYIERLPLNKAYGTISLETEPIRIARMECAEELFDRFLHEGMEFGAEVELEDNWNATFNSFDDVDYDSFSLNLNGMSDSKDGRTFELYEQQKKGIAFLCTKGNGLLAYDVGVGKTACGICAAIHQMQSGNCRRPLIIVPNAVYSKWVHDITELFPSVTLNSLYNLNGKIISSMDIQDNTLSICTGDAISNIYFKDESVSSWISEDFNHILSKKKIKSFFEIPEKVKAGEFVYFEDCGFDLLVVDEAHRYKNLVRRTANTKVYCEYSKLGFGEPSSRALKMFALTQYVHRNNDNKNVFFLTATPFTNSPMEIYSMLLFVNGSQLKNMGYSTINDFLDEFAEITIEWAVEKEGDVRQKVVMKKFRSLFALQNIIKNCMDKINADDAHIKRPEKESHLEKLYMTDIQQQIYKKEIQRLESGTRKLGDIFLAMNNMRMAMLSPVLVSNSDYDFSIPPIEELVTSSPKLTLVCNCVIECYKAKSDCGQIIYMLRGVKESQILKNYLVEGGIPEKAIGLINSGITEAKKDKMTSDFNDPQKQLKVIIGSETISEGIDLNGNSIALYNCMLGWNPSEPVQVEGRLWRQGNRQKTVHIVYPIMYNSIDSLIYQKHDEKGTRIDAIWSYRGDKLNVEEINPEDLKIELIENPQKKADYLIAQESLPITRKIKIIQEKLDLADEVRKKAEEIDRLRTELNLDIIKYRSKNMDENSMMMTILTNKMNQYNKKYSQVSENYKNLLNTFLPKNESENDKILEDLRTQKKEEELKLLEINNKKSEIIKKLQEEARTKKNEKIFEVSELVKKLVEEIL